MQKPLISICTFGKNDDYMPDFLYRIETTITFLSQSICNIEKEDLIEIIVVDWASKKPLNQAIRLNDKFRNLVKFLYIKQEDIIHFGEKNISNHSFVQNLAIRRAKGSYIFIFAADTFMNASGFLILFNVLNDSCKTSFDIKQTFYSIGRKHIPWEIISQQPDTNYIKEYIERKGHELLNDHSFLKWGGGAGFLGMHRDLWYSMEGLDEGLEFYGSADVEIFFRSTNQYEHVELSNSGICSYHMEHPPELQTSESKYVGKNYDIFTQERKQNNSWGCPERKLDFAYIESNIDIDTKKDVHYLSENTKFESMTPHIGDLFSNFDINMNRSIFVNNLLITSHLIQFLKPKYIIFENSLYSLLYVFFCAKFYHLPKYIVFSCRNSKIFGKITSSIEYLSQSCAFKGIINWVTNSKHIVEIDDIHESLIVLTNSINRQITLKNDNKSFFYYLSFDKYSKISNHDFEIFKSSEISSKLDNLNSGILIKTSKVLVDFNFQVNLDMECNPFRKNKFRNFARSLKQRFCR